MPDVDELFPSKSVDELFPPQVAAERYRRDTLGTSPIQDLIFGDTTVNPIARVLDAFGQGFKQGWGSEPAGLSQESTDSLKKIGIFNNYDQGQKSIIKAANESLFRSAAVGLVDPIMRGLPAGFAGLQAATAQVGEEAGQPKLGREAAGAFEAFPTGLRAPTGIPHEAPHPMLAEIERAKQLGVIGAGEEGYFGNAPSEPAPPISGPQAAPKGMPVDLFAEPRDTSVGTAQAPKPEAAPVASVEAQEVKPSPIADDVAARLVAAGRPPEEAQASGQIIASHYEARSQRFGGERGTPEQLYVTEGPEIRSGQGAPPAKSAIKPPEGDTGAPEPVAPETPPQSGGAAEAIADVPALKKALRGRAAADPQTWSLYEMLASEGGLKPTADLHSIFGNTRGPFVPGFGPLLRPSGLSMDEALTRAKESGYILDPNDIQHVAGAENKGELTKTVNDLQDMIAEESRGRKNYRTDHVQPEAKVDPEVRAKEILDELHQQVEADGGKVDPALERRVVEIMTKEGETNVHAAYERAIMEDHDNYEGRLDVRRATKETANIRGHDAPDSGAAPDTLKEFVDDSGYAWSSEQEARDANVREPSGHGANDRAAAEFELNQTNRGNSSLNRTASWVIRNKETKEVIMETFDRKKVDALNTEKYEAVPIGEYLGSLNKKERELFQKSEKTHAGDQFILGGAEQSAKQLAAARGDKLKAKVPQKEPGDLFAPKDDAAQRELFQSSGKTDTPEFKKWFGNSKVVDKEGQPLLVYHGAPDARFIQETGEFKSFNERYNQPESGEKKAFFFAADRRTAASYADDRRAFDYQNAEPATIPAYLSLQNPMIIDRRGAKWHGTDSAVKDAKAGGYDGIVIKNVIDSYQVEGKATDVYVAFDSRQIKSPENSGAFDPNNPRIFDQIKRGKINLRNNAKPIITLFKDANASTFIHETGHAWLEELMQDAEHPLAPAELKTDAVKVLDWLGVRDAQDIKTSHHEKFARGFERYMMEGKAPNQALAGVFAKFRNWLTKIYQTVTRLKSPINDEIRGVFDRLLTLKPSQVVIEPEVAKTFADIHEADAEHTPPEMARPAAMTIQGERDSIAARHIPEEQDARLKDVAERARRSEAGNPQPASNPDEAGTLPGEAGNAEASGTVGTGGNEAAPESPRTPTVNRTEPPVSAHDKFPDKAGNIRLDNLNTPEDLNQIIRQTAEENGDFQNVRGPVSDAQVLDLAEAAGVDAAFIDSRKLGEAWTAPQIVALRRLLIQSAQSVHDLAIKAASGSEAEVMAYAEAKARHQLIQERVSSVTAEAGRALRAFQSKFTEGVAGDVSQFLKDATGKTLFQLQQEAKFLSKLQTPQQTSKFVNDTSKGTFRNAILEYYINALISGPVTHSRYIVSNAVNSLWTPLVEIPIAAGVRAVREVAKGEPMEGVRFGEAGAQLYGMVKGSRDGISAAIEAFKSGVSPALPNEKVSAHFAEASKAIPGQIGQVLRIPSRSVAGIHSFFKALRYEQNVQALAYRTAANEGLRGDAFTNRVADLTTSPTEAMMTEATNNALKELYMSPTEYHSKMGGLVRFTNQNLAAKIVVPFMKIGSQITRNAFIERSPLGLLDKKVRADLSGEMGGAQLDFQAAKITGGMALMAASVGLMSEGMMTGDGPEDPAKRAVWLLSHSPASIQIGDLQFKYGNTGPLGMLMRFAANTYETAEHMGDSDMATLAVSFFEGFAKSVLDETFLRGVKDALDAMFHPKEYGGRYIKSQITNWIPWSVGLSQVARKVDPFSRETHGIWQAAQAKIPYLSEQLMPRRDMFGEPIRNDGPSPDYANDPVVKAMDDLHLGVGKIGKKIRGVDLTEQQYDDLSRIAGRMAKTRLNAMVGVISNPQVPAGQRIEMIHTAISTSREAARSLIMMQNPDIIKAASDAKVTKLRGTATVH